MQVETKDILHAAAVICAGVMANPTSGRLLDSQYERQMLIDQMLQDVRNAVVSTGINIVDSNDSNEDQS